MPKKIDVSMKKKKNVKRRKKTRRRVGKNESNKQPPPFQLRLGGRSVEESYEIASLFFNVTPSLV